MTIPDDLVGLVDGCSSIGRLALVVHTTSGLIDPGFQGQITLEMSNIGRMRVGDLDTLLFERQRPQVTPAGAAVVLALAPQLAGAGVAAAAPS